MRANEFIIEAVGGNYLYHGVPRGETVSAIIKSGFIQPHEQFEFDCDDPTNHKLCPPVVSLSRDQLLRFPYGGAVAQFVIDKDALTRAGIIAKPQVGTAYDRSESEERVYKAIPVKAPYVVAIQYDPKLKVPKPILDYAQQVGIRMEPWKQINPRATDDNQTPKIKPATEYTDPKALKLKSQDWFGDIVWTISYDKGTSGNIIQPYYMVKDEIAVKKAYTAIKDRIAKGQSFDDLLPQSQYGKTWSRGRTELKPGDKGYK